MITSARNPRIQAVRKLLEQASARREAGAFVIEGLRLIEEACQAGWYPRELFYTEDLSQRGRELLAICQGAGAVLEMATPQVMKSVSDTQTPQGLLAVVPQKPLLLPERLDFVLILDALRDPGNMGTILRTAAAAGVQAVLLTPGCADPFAPKVVRAAMGAHFRLPVAAMDWEQLGRLVKPPGGVALSVYLADVQRGVAYHRVNFCQPVALLIGSEAEGAGEQARRLADELVHIPMPGGFESLNAGVAAAILMFEVVRQRSL